VWARCGPWLITKPVTITPLRTHRVGRRLAPASTKAATDSHDNTSEFRFLSALVLLLRL